MAAGVGVVGQAEEHAARVRVVVRRALARQVGQEELGAARSAARFGASATSSARRCRRRSACAAQSRHAGGRRASRSSGASVPGRQWQKACTARAGFGRKRVGRRRRARPRCRATGSRRPAPTTPMPTALAALSPPPPATGTPAGMPQRARDVGAQRAGGVGAFDQARHVRARRGRWRRAARRDQSRAADVEPQRAGGVGHVADAFSPVSCSRT